MKKAPALSVLTVLLLASCNLRTAPATIAPVAAGPTSEQPTSTPVPLEQIPRVSVQDARAAYDQGAAVFVDVRDRGAYELGHIAGALSIPLTGIGTRMSELDPQAWIITYCT